MAAIEFKLQQYFNLECIDKYMSLIQKLVLSSPNTLSPMAVLRELLRDYQLGAFHNFSISNFFISQFRSHTRFAQELLDNLEHADFNLAQQLDQYLKDHKLDKKGDFFSLSLAWSYYYKATLVDLSNYENLKKQIIIPLHIFRKEKLTSEINFCVEKLQSDDPDIIWAACIILRKIPILELSKQQEVSEKLLEMTDKETLVKNPDCLQQYCYFKQAFESLSNIPVSNEMSEKMVDVLLMRMSGPYNCEELYLLLKNIPIPNAKIQSLMNLLYKQIEHERWDIRRAAWEVIQCYDNENERKIKWIDSILEQIDSASSEVQLGWYSNDNSIRIVESLLLKLATASIPDERKEKIIHCAFNLINRFDRQETARDACLVIRNCAPLSNAAFNDWVVAKLLSMLEKAESTIYEGYDALSRLHIPEEDMERVVKLLIAGLKSEHLAYSNVLNCIRNIRFPIELKNHLINQLISVIKDDSRMLQMESYSVLAELGIPDDELENIVSLMLNRFSDKARNCWERNYILEALPKINIPSILMQPLQKILLAYALQQIADTNLISNSCVTLGEMRLYPENALLIIRELITMLRLGKIHCDRIDGVLEGIYGLSKSLDTSIIISIQIMLDHVISTNKDTVIAMSLFSFRHQLEQLRGQKEFLESAKPELPPEIIFHISKSL